MGRALEVCLSPFVLYPNALLAKKALAAPVDARLIQIGERLREAAVEAKAYGLAAAHIGEIEPIMVLNVTPEAPEPAYTLYFNPRVTAAANETEAGGEASVSLPGVEVEIVRPIWAEIAYDDADGVLQSIRFEGFAARCALHEIEQIEGRYFLNNLSRLKRDMALKKAAKRRPG
jgi:peptide deformylase